MTPERWQQVTAQILRAAELLNKSLPLEVIGGSRRFLENCLAAKGRMNKASL